MPQNMFFRYNGMTNVPFFAALDYKISCGELQPHQGGSAVNRSRRVTAHPVRPGTATAQ